MQLITRKFVSILIFVKHTGSSTFELPDLSPYFPYFPASGKMSEEDHSFYLFELDQETQKVKRAFGSLRFDLEQNLETQKLENVIRYLELIKSDLKKLFTDCKSIEDVFDIFDPYSSFFDFELVKSLTHKFGSTGVKEKFKKYKKMFQKYLKHRVVECPHDSFGDIGNSEKVYVLKTDKSLETLTADDLKVLQYKLSKILENKLLRLLRVETGCMQLTFRGVEEEQLNIGAEIQQALRDVGVLSIRYGDQYVNISEKFMKQGIKMEKIFGEKRVHGIMVAHHISLA